MKLEDCTKEELLEIIKKGCAASFISEFKVGRFLAELEYKRSLGTIAEAEKYNRAAVEYRQKYTEILAPYKFYRMIDIPRHILQEADQCLKAARRADRNYELCMKRLGD